MRSTLLGWMVAILAFAGFCGWAQAAPTTQGYRAFRIVSNGAVSARAQDPGLLNPWGLAFGPTGGYWVAANGSGLATSYDLRGRVLAGPITIPASIGNPNHGTPTGMIYNWTGANFMVKFAARSAPAQFLFATEDGTISAYNPAVSTSRAIRMVDRSPYQANYKGLAIARVGRTDYLYAANFHAGTIDVFDNKFRPVHLRGQFDDETVPGDYAPFNITNIGGKLYVSYAQRDPLGQDDVPGAGSGLIDVFNADGTFYRRMVTGGALNSPWGIAYAPSTFGKFARRLLVGNFGDGRINAFNVRTGGYVGTLSDLGGKIITEDGLWGMGFRGDRLYFTAGLNEEADGLFGSLAWVPPPAPAALSAAPPAVPEPSAAVLPLLAAAGLLRRRHRA